jgi:myosin-crossreactive antigen
MRYASGNFEAFARPRKPEGVETKTAWFVGSGLVALAGAAFLIRDGHMAGEKITILEELDLLGGELDGANVPEKGFVIRGGRVVNVLEVRRKAKTVELENRLLKLEARVFVSGCRTKA